MSKRQITKADANIFEELGLPDAENLKVRAQLMAQITQIWRDSGLRQYEMAERMEVNGPRFSDVVNGKIEKCSVERLINMLGAIGLHVSVIVDEAA
jgi:predicted XRE-type DNA-binding protein